jgi:hypothetical protein
MTGLSLREGESRMSNRILSLLPQCCPSCAARRQIERDRDRLIATAERLELLSDDAIEFFIPSAEKLLEETGPETDDDDDDGLHGIRFFVHLQPRRATLQEDLTQYAITELRHIATVLTDAADKIESEVAR